MFTSAFRILTAAVVTGIALAPGVASAATIQPAAPTYFFSSNAPSGSDPSTTVTFTVTTGELSISVPTATNLGSGAPGTTITGALGAVTVTDDRAALNASWTATAASTDWTTGGGTSPETIPATDVTYNPGAVTTTGTVTATPSQITLSGTAQTVVAATAVIGDNTASWDPSLAVAVPAAAVSGTYTATLSHSVS
jgi:hypothetical protein